MTAPSESVAFRRISKEGITETYTMPSLLHIDSSPRRDSTSSALAKQFVEGYTQKHGDVDVVYHNTSLESLPFITELNVQAGFTPADARSPEMTQSLETSNKLTQEVLAADVIVIGVPMWNFGVPASLKAWIDLIVRNGLTFAYAPAGPVGLIPAGKKVYIFASRGGEYPAGSPAHAYDLQEPYLRAILGFLGLTDVQCVVASNQNRGPEEAKAGRDKAEAELNALLA